LVSLGVHFFASPLSDLILTALLILISVSYPQLWHQMQLPQLWCFKPSQFRAGLLLVL
jgi:hypothetical protein